MDRKIRSKIVRSPFLWIGVVVLTLINIFSYHKQQQIIKEAEEKVILMAQNTSINNINTFKSILYNYIDKLKELNRITALAEIDINEGIEYLIEEDSIFANIEVIHSTTNNSNSYALNALLQDSVKYLQITVPIAINNVGNKALSLKIPLNELHKKVAENKSLSYAYITLSYNNIYIYHPNELKIGLSSIKTEQDSEIEKETVSKTFSDYLGIPVYTYYETLDIDDQTWIIAANVPDISFNELITNIRRAFTYMGLSASLAFSFILFLGILFWQKEFIKRQQAEKDKIKLELKNELQKQQVLATQLEQLKAGLNPHFLFNSLSSLKVLVSKRPEEAKKFAIALSNLYRYLLKQQNFDLTTLAEELKFSQDYIYLQQIRFQNRIKVTIDIDSEALNRQLPPMSLQLLIENCIKHTRMTENEPLEIEVYTASNYLFVKNNYNPHTHIHSSGIGLENLSKRYSHLTNLPCSFTIENNHFVAKVPIF